MAIISRFRAVAMVGKLRLTGVIAWLMWLAVHLVYITGFKNRVTAVLHWFVSFLGRGRSERTTTEQQIFARSALARLKRGATDLVSDPGAYDAARRDARDHPARRARGAGRRGGAAHRRRASAACTTGERGLTARYSKRSPARRPPRRAARAHRGRMKTPSASTVTPSASARWPTA